MIKIKIFIFFILLGTAFNTRANINKLDPQLGLLVLYPQRIEFTQLQSTLKKSVDGYYIDVIITFDRNSEELYNSGVKIKCIHDNIAVASVPVNRLEKIAALPSVYLVESSKPSYPNLDISTNFTGAVKVREQFGYTGKGVLIGIIDSGIDWQHESFINTDGTTRIKYLLDMSMPGPVYGSTLYTENDINNALQGMGYVEERDYSGHGTHVAGIAAGDGSTDVNYGTYAGVAPDAGLVIVKATRDEFSSEFQTADQIIALHFIDSVATALHMPYVVNLSFGGHSGAHNGTSSVERIIDNIVGPGKPGKAVVTVAGNDRQNDVHAQAEFGNGTYSKEISFIINEYYPIPGSGNDRVIFDIWYDGNQKIDVTVITPGGLKIGPVNQGEVLDNNTNEGAVYVWNGFYETKNGYLPGFDQEIGNYEIYIDINDKNSLNTPRSGTWRIKFSGPEGNVDAWITNVLNDAMNARFVEGNVDFGKISVPGTAHNSISVGAYISKKVWTDMDGNRLTYDGLGLLEIGDIATFSSPGPTRDLRTKPEITAPGQIIASSYSKDAPPQSSVSIFQESNPDFPNALILEGGRQALSSGTSMAVPHVTGAAALILEKFPEITAIQIRDMLTNSASTDFTERPVPNNDWGWGKLDIFSALQRIPGEEIPLKYKLFNAMPNPFYGSTTIRFELPVQETFQLVEINIYNVLGQKVKNLKYEKAIAGPYDVKWDGRDDMGYKLASGVYFVEYKVGNLRQINKIAYLGSLK
ncbi:S8 family serine peptidase [candidate division KSB1 bacterium]|nr:S8 family serine peptidase [candidate division KSB1 bacterium]